MKKIKFSYDFMTLTNTISRKKYSRYFFCCLALFCSQNVLSGSLFVLLSQNNPATSKLSKSGGSKKKFLGVLNQNIYFFITTWFIDFLNCISHWVCFDNKNRGNTFFHTHIFLLAHKKIYIRKRSF